MFCVPENKRSLYDRYGKEGLSGVGGGGGGKGMIFKNCFTFVSVMETTDQVELSEVIITNDKWYLFLNLWLDLEADRF